MGGLPRASKNSATATMKASSSSSAACWSLSPAANAPLDFLRRSLASSQNRDVELADMAGS